MRLREIKGPYSFIQGPCARLGAGTAHKEVNERSFFRGNLQPRGELLERAKVFLPLSYSGHIFKMLGGFQGETPGVGLVVT